MKLDSVTAEIRPRGDWEAIDLGLAMVRRDFWRCFAVWWLALLLPMAAAGWWLWESPVLWLMTFWWWKPAGSRLVLFELSRRLFGELPSAQLSLSQIPAAWTRRFFYRFIWARFSPWLPVTLAVEDLERLRGKPYKLRCRQITRRSEGVVIWLYLVSDTVACWLGIACIMLAKIFIPDGLDTSWRVAIESWDPENPSALPCLILRAFVVCFMLAMSLTDVFITGAGFGVYLNNRTWIEGWDVELAFKRLALRLGKPAHLVFLLCVGCMPLTSLAATERDPAQIIREVMTDEAFKVHTVIENVPNPSNHSLSWDWQMPDWMGSVLMSSALALIIVTILWLLWKNQRAFKSRRIRMAKPAVADTSRIIIGRIISSETLPHDMPAAAWALWQQDLPKEALALLYRGAIFQAITRAHVPILESDTENDCLRRVNHAGPHAYPDYFRRITDTWSRLAYAGLMPTEHEVADLCQQWPFIERSKL